MRRDKGFQAIILQLTVADPASINAAVRRGIAHGVLGLSGNIGRGRKILQRLRCVGTEPVHRLWNR
jgi:hypothetical protein